MPVPINSQLVRRNDADFKLIDDTDVGGSYKSVANSAARDDLVNYPALLKIGMLVYLQDTGVTYKLASMSPITWTAQSVGGQAILAANAAALPVGLSDGAIAVNQTTKLLVVVLSDIWYENGLPVAPTPTISSLSSNDGYVGDPIVITGTNFYGITSVDFNGTSAVYVVDSPTQITTSVPIGATTGDVTVINPVDTAISPSSFTVLETYEDAILADSPTMWWRLDEAAGLIASDSSGNANSGSIGAGITLGAAGLIGSDPSNTAFSGAGTENSVSAASGLGVLGNSTPFSVELWMNATTLTAVSAPYAGIGLSVPNFNWVFIMSPDGTVGAGNGNGTPLEVGPGAIIAGTTYHFVYTWDGTNERLYKNGILIGGPVNPALDPGVWNGFSAGGITGISEFRGTLDEVSVYNGQELSATRVLAHYNAGI